MSSLLGGKQKSTSSTTVNVPEWALGSLKQALQMGTDAANIPYEAYTGERLAGFTPDELRAQGMTEDMIGRYTNQYNQASDIMNQVAQSGLNGFSQDYLNQYMNPYQENVLDVAKRRSLENYSQQMNDFNAKAAQTSSFGGSRTGLAQAQMQRDFQQNLADQDTLGLANNYNQALTQANLGMQRAATGAQGLASLAGQQYGYDLSDISALSAVGESQRAMNQAGLDLDYENWATEKAYPYQQAQFLQSIASPIAGQVSGQTQTQTQKSGGSLLGTAIGLGSMAMGIPGVSAAMGGLAGGASAGLGMGFGTASGLNSFFGGSSLSPFMKAFMGSGGGMYSKGGVVAPNSYASGGVIQGLQDYLDVPSALLYKYLNGETPDNLERLSQTYPFEQGNELAEWGIENPVDAATAALTAVPIAGAVAKLGVGGLKGIGALGGLGKAGLAAAKNNPQTAALLTAALLQGSKYLGDSSEALQDQNAKDISDAQSYLIYKATGGKAGTKFDNPEDKARIEATIASNPELYAIGKQYFDKQQTAQGAPQVPEDKLTNTGGLNTIAANDASVDDVAKSFGLGTTTGTSGTAKKDEFNVPLMKFGAALLSSQNGFFTALGEGMEAFTAQKDLEERQATAAKKAQLEQALDLYKAQTERKRADSYAKQVDNPWSQTINALKAKKMQQQLSQGDNKLRDQLLLSIAKSGMSKDPAADAAKIMESLNASNDLDESQYPGINSDPFATQ